MPKCSTQMYKTPFSRFLNSLSKYESKSPPTKNTNIHANFFLTLLKGREIDKFQERHNQHILQKQNSDKLEIQQEISSRGSEHLSGGNIPICSEKTTNRKSTNHYHFMAITGQSVLAGNPS